MDDRAEVAPGGIDDDQVMMAVPQTNDADLIDEMQIRLGDEAYPQQESP